MSNRLPAGGFLTTSEDLAGFASAVLEHRLASSETLKIMLTPQKTKGGTVLDYGLGWGLFAGEDWYGEREAFHGRQSPQVSNVLHASGASFCRGDSNELGRRSRTGFAASIAKIVLDLGR